MTKGLAITQEASIDQVVVAKLDNFCRKRSMLVTGTDKGDDGTLLFFIFHVSMFTRVARKQQENSG